MACATFWMRGERQDERKIWINLLALDDLRVDFHTPTGIVNAVRGLSFTLGRERLGIVGESGSGKSMTGRAILDLIPHPGVVTAKRMEFRGQDLGRRWTRAAVANCAAAISMVMQDPKFSLNPVQTVGDQIAEAYRVHHKASAREAKERSLAMLEEAADLREPQRVYGLYPHEVSGGMGQRVMIAMMLIAEPDILIADEPTSALDVTVQLQILKILDDLVTSRGMGLIFISHDLHLVKSFCDRVIVMYGGKAMETLPALDRAQHPYTRGLLAARPIRPSPRQASRPPATRHGWHDHTTRHHRREAQRFLGDSHVVKDLLRRLAGRELWHRRRIRLRQVDRAACARRPQPRVERRGRHSRQARQPKIRDKAFYRAADGLPDPTARCIRRRPSTIRWPSRSPSTASASGEAKITRAMADVGLPASFRFRFPHQLSGGQRQRVAIARALGAGADDPPARRADPGARRLDPGRGAAGAAPGAQAHLYPGQPRSRRRRPYVRAVAGHAVRPRAEEMSAETLAARTPRTDYARQLLIAMRPAGRGSSVLPVSLAGEGARRAG